MNKEKNQPRILARFMAKVLTVEEIDLVSGGGSCTQTSGCTASTCSSSDNNSCDLDTCGDTKDVSGTGTGNMAF